ncbi:MAG: hypothetical protein H0U71_08400 [Gammaproteobacteria bacterium]|nr:hypothetical protein [Gammaproteobacteria bacterium]
MKLGKFFIAGLILTNSAYALGSDCCFVPYCNKWSFDIGWLSLRPTDDFLTHINYLTTQAVGGTTFWAIDNANTDYLPGFRIALHYDYCPLQSLNLAYGHVSGITNTRVDVPSGSKALSAPISFFLSSDAARAFIGNVTTVALSQKTHFDNVDLVYNKSYPVNCFVNLDLLVGIQALGVSERMNVEHILTNATGEFGADNVHYNNNSVGVGPEIGAGVSLKLLEKLSLFSSAEAIVLGGYSSSKFHEHFAAVGATPNDLNLHFDDSTRVVPGVSGQIGLRYSNDFRHFGFKISAGYQLAKYFNFIDNNAFIDTDLGSITTGVAITTPHEKRELSDFSVGGFFASVGVHL